MPDGSFSIDSEKAEVSTTEVPQLRSAEAGALSKTHIFQDPNLAEHWHNVYEKTQYESRHRFDPELEWTAEQEKRLVRKLDIYLMIWVWMMFFALDLMRYNINRVLASSMLKDTGMNQNDTNNGQIIFYVSFLLMELPGGVISKKLGAERWVPTQMVAWSIVSACQSAMKNRTGFFITRALMGITMGGFIPDMCLYLSYFYTSKELNLRTSCFYTALGLSQVIGTFLSVGFLALDGLNGVAGWRYLFAFDALISGVIAIFTFFFMPPTVTRTSGRVRGRKGWFTPEEEGILVNRVLRDDPFKGDMNNRQGVKWSDVWFCLKDLDSWPLYLLGFSITIPSQPPSTYLSFILRLLNYNVRDSNLLAIPSQILWSLNMIWPTLLSNRLREKSLVSSLAGVWGLPCLIALVSLPHAMGSHYGWSRYALLTLLIPCPYPLPLMVGWVSENAYSVRTRTVGLCFFNMSVQAGSIVATRFYTDGDKPYYAKGNSALLAVAAFTIVQCVATKMYYLWRNRQKSRAWSRLSYEERIEYTKHTQDLGSRRLDARFVH